MIELVTAYRTASEPEITAGAERDSVTRGSNSYCRGSLPHPPKVNSSVNYGQRLHLYYGCIGSLCEKRFKRVFLFSTIPRRERSL